ncbi:Short-chain dehydrogenase cctT [Vanrija pseudolonga]|uniref:Short-chain dehydrogenase cctT n=1 Tax=Vanrija pseudolonga TaxID=143232 RepID=A0AAF1BGQ1_9TREE|nr:Short-chain dehydrogenase cctT [Vanrija pseudolonga]
MTQTTGKRVALITGCSEPSSLGALLALELAKVHDYRVFASARRVETLKGLAAEGLDILELDVTQADSIAAAVKSIRRAAGRLDLLVNNAGVAGFSPLLDTSIDALRAMIEINTIAPLALAQACVPLLVRGAESGRDAVIANVCSTAKDGLPFIGAYGVSKVGAAGDYKETMHSLTPRQAAATTLSDTLRREVADVGIKVVTLEFGTIKTQMSAGDKVFELAGTPTGLYKPTEELEAATKAMMLRNHSIAPDAASVTRRVATALAADSPPRKIWAGVPSFISRWVIPLLATWLLDAMLRRVMKVREMVRKPVVR